MFTKSAFTNILHVITHMNTLHVNYTLIDL